MFQMMNEHEWINWHVWKMKNSKFGLSTCEIESFEFYDIIVNLML